MTKPVTIRQHLIPFLFRELEGRESEYMSMRSKLITIYSYSTIGKFINYQMNKFYKLYEGNKVNAFTLYLSIEKKGATNYRGSIYVSEKKTYTELLLTAEQNDEINDLLEDLFRISFCYYIDGAMEHNPDMKLLKAIDNFIEKYDLLEAGFSRYTLKMLYYREKKKDKKLSRTQRHSANRFLNFS